LVIALFFTYLNLFQTSQALNGVLHTTLTTKEYYWRVFLKNEASDEDRRWLEPAQYAEGRDELPKNDQYRIVYSSSLLPKDSVLILGGANLFSKNIIIPTSLPYDKIDHYIVSEITADTNSGYALQDMTGHIVTYINKSGKLYKYRSKDFTFSDLKDNNGNANLPFLVPPQAADEKFLIVTYIYVDQNSKLKLLSFNCRVWRRKVKNENR
jgi:hypothetical protein